MVQGNEAFLCLCHIKLGDGPSDSLFAYTGILFCLGTYALFCGKSLTEESPVCNADSGIFRSGALI